MSAHRSLGSVVACLALFAGCNAVSGIGSYEATTDAPPSSPFEPASDAGAPVGPSEKDGQAPTPPPPPSGDGGIDSGIDAGVDGGKPLHVFVTSTKSGSVLGGASGADKICQTRASEAGRDGAWVAWLSSTAGDFSALSRITAEGPWYLFDGTTVAVASRAELTSGSISHGIDMDEKGATGVDDDVWTGTNAAAGGDAPTDCLGWKGYGCAGICPTGTSGRTNARTASWTSAAKKPCGSSDQRLYCFEN